MFIMLGVTNWIVIIMELFSGILVLIENETKVRFVIVGVAVRVAGELFTVIRFEGATKDDTPDGN